MDGRKAPNRIPAKGKVTNLVSAGGVVYRVRNEDVEIALCGRRVPARWSLPKGTPDEGETIVQTAIREAQEETGLVVEVEAPIGSINYWFVAGQDHTRLNKTVHFYLMKSTGGSTEDHDPEFDVVQWFEAEAALKHLAFANEARILDQALVILRQKAEKD